MQTELISKITNESRALDTVEDFLEPCTSKPMCNLTTDQKWLLSSSYLLPKSSTVHLGLDVQISKKIFSRARGRQGSHPHQTCWKMPHRGRRCQGLLPASMPTRLSMPKSLPTLVQMPTIHIIMPRKASDFYNLVRGSVPMNKDLDKNTSWLTCNSQFDMSVKCLLNLNK